ncbi:MAG: cation:proton antiporter [Helicobacteraceae bacterium]|jgi:CPA2 family monovalent cation:H+ antiporter-2|nr:cation:proton antiporter [Helicobacteraceae bacterium]
MDAVLVVVVAAALIAVTLNLYLKRFGIPPVIGYIASGVAVAQLFSIAGEYEVLNELGEFGIVFLMFTIGLEFSISYLRSMRKEVFVFGALQVIITAIVFALIAVFGMGIDPKTAVVLASALSMSSTAIVLKILKEKGEIAKPYGRQVLGILIFQDIAVIPALLMVTLFSKPDVTPLALIAQMIVSAVIVLIVLSTIGKFLMTQLLMRASNSQTHEIFVGTILLVVVGAALLAHEFGFSYSLGALIAGIMIAETRYKHQVEADLAPFRDILLGVFFVTVGLQIDLKLLANNIIFISLVVVIVMAIKALIIFAVLRIFSDKTSAIRSSIALMQMGEFGFAIFALAAHAGILPDKQLLGEITVAVAISMVLTPFILKQMENIAQLFERKSIHAAQHISFESARLANHVIVIGYGAALGQQLAQMLKELDTPYLCIEGQYNKVEDGIERGHAVLLGNATQSEILEKAGVKDALAVIVATDREHEMRLIAEKVLEINPHINLILKTNSRMTPHLFDDLNVNIIDEYQEAARQMIAHALGQTA